MKHPLENATVMTAIAAMLSGCSVPIGGDGPPPRPARQVAQIPPANTPALPRTGPLSIAQCVRFGFAKSFGLRVADQNLRIAQAEIERARAEFDPLVFGSIRRDTINGRDWSGVNASAGVNKRFATGTEIEFEGGRVPTRTGDFRRDYLGGGTSDYAISIRQQLLRGADPKANRTGIRLAELVRDASQATRSAEILEMLRAAESGYYAAAVAGLVEKTYSASLHRSEEVLADVNARHAAGAASKLDVLEAEVLLSAARERALAAGKNYMDRVDELWLAIGAPQRGHYPTVHFTAITDATIPSRTPDIDVEIRRALTLAPTATLLVNEVHRREVELRKARNSALPRLEVEFSAASVQPGSSGSNSNDWEGVAIARVTLPWTFRAERAQLNQAKAALDRSSVTREEAEQRLRVRVSELCRAITFGRQQLAAAVKSHRASKAKWQEQLLRRKEGIVSVRELREAEEDLRTSEVRVHESRLAQLGAWSALGQLDGSIAARHDFEF